MNVTIAQDDGLAIADGGRIGRSVPADQLLMADETKAMPPLRITAWGEGWEKTEYMRVDAFAEMVEKLTTANKRIAELENTLLYINEHAKALQERCKRVATGAPSEEKSMFDLLME